MPILVKLFPNIEEERILPNSFHDMSITLMPESKTLQKKENYRSPSLMKTDAKILNQMLANDIQQHTERVIPQDQVGFISGKQK